MKNIYQKYKKMPLPVKASLWFLICSFFQKGITMITTPIFTRILSTDEYGQYSVFQSWHQIIAPVICLNLFYGVYSQGIVKFEEDRDRFTSSLQGLTFTLIFVWSTIYLFTANFWNSIFGMSTSKMIAMFFMIWASGVFVFWSMNQRVDFKYKKLVTITAIASVIQPLLSIILIMNCEDKVEARIWGIVIAQLLLYSWMFVAQILKGKQFFSKKYWIYALKFNIPLLPHYLSMNALSSSDRIMIERMVGDSQAGIYNLAYSVSLIMTMFNTALMHTMEPWIYRKLKENKIKDIAAVAYPCFLAIAGLNILLIMFAPEIIAFFAPESYGEAIWTIPSVALSVFFMFLYTFFATFEFYYEKTKYIAFATIGGAVLNIILNYFGIRAFGYIAAGYTTLLSYILFAFLHYYFMSKVCKEHLDNIKPYNWKIIFIIALCSLLLGFGIKATYQNTIVRYCLIIIVFIGLIIMHKKIIEIVKMFMNIKKQKD